VRRVRGSQRLKIEAESMTDGVTPGTQHSPSRRISYSSTPHTGCIARLFIASADECWHADGGASLRRMGGTPAGGGR
jgi:hypothetical protein